VTFCGACCADAGVQQSPAETAIPSSRESLIVDLL
jgi:hypothetical protein